ncbi:MAG: hypothetical protein WAV41_00830 [Microgenomates group bacterium]
MDKLKDRRISPLLELLSTVNDHEVIHGGLSSPDCQTCATNTAKIEKMIEARIAARQPTVEPHVFALVKTVSELNIQMEGGSRGPIKNAAFLLFTADSPVGRLQTLTAGRSMSDTTANFPFGIRDGLTLLSDYSQKMAEFTYNEKWSHLSNLCRNW